MDTIWLEDFLALLDEGGFSRAAHKRAVSQSAFSRRIRALEDWVGVPLIERTTHSVRLTAAGERLRPVAEETLRRLHQGRHEALLAAQASGATIRFAATHVLSLTFFPPWLRDLEARLDSPATFELTADHMVACENLMVEGKAHLLLCHHHPAARTRLEEPAFLSTTIGEDRLVPVGTPARVRVGGPYLAYAPTSGMGRILAASGVARGDGREPAFTSHLAGVLATLARDGRGIAWVPLSLVAADLEAERLARAGSADDQVAMDIRLFRPRARQNAAVEALWTAVTGPTQAPPAISP
ncbi:LysR family transcriptional regulator [Xanthobacter sp. VTT E-85241]|uniref:LysR family transcriptional regulator n=1 Tax=Roseixanthobacter finlandensis TaxID=3119922 RepID=UPI0037291FAE